MFSKLTEMLDSFLTRGTPGYDCAVYKDGQCIYRHMNGYSDRENKVLMNGTEHYYLYSVSKVITVTAALMLYERGAFSLDDKLEKYIPEYSRMLVATPDGGTRPAENPITIKDLFCMTAGFNYRLKNPAIVKFREETEGKCPTSAFAKYAAESILDFEPGTRWQYSICHDVLASLVEIISGERFGDFVKKNIFDPLGMKDSTYNLPASERDKLCIQYRYDHKTQTSSVEGPTNCYYLGDEFESGGAGCVSTVDDVIKFAEGFREGKLLSDETIELMSTNKIAHCLDSFIVENYAYGLGVRCSRGNDTISDIGWGGAAGAALWIDRKNGISMFYAQHVLNTPINKNRNKMIAVVKDLLGMETHLLSEDEKSSASRDAFASKFGV